LKKLPALCTVARTVQAEVNPTCIQDELVELRRGLVPREELHHLGERHAGHGEVRRPAVEMRRRGRTLHRPVQLEGAEAGGDDVRLSEMVPALLESPRQLA